MMSPVEFMVQSFTHRCADRDLSGALLRLKAQAPSSEQLTGANLENGMKAILRNVRQPIDTGRVKYFCSWRTDRSPGQLEDHFSH